MLLAGLAMIMTLRSARRGVQRMKNGGLIAGSHDPRYRPQTGGYNNGNRNGRSSFGNPFGSGGGSTTSPYTGSSTSSSYGSGSSTSSSSPYKSSTSPYSNTGSTTGTLSNGQSPRPLADLIDKHGSSVIRVLDAHKFQDFGGTHEFYGQVETLTAVEGAGVVEKVLQSPAGTDKVLVIDGGASTNAGIFGKTAVGHAKQNGWKGVIVNGAVFNTKDIAAVAVGCKALGANPNRGRATSGSKGSTLNIGGQSVSSGMWIYADKDGIVVSDSELRLDGSSSSLSSSSASSSNPYSSNPYSSSSTSSSSYSSSSGGSASSSSSPYSSGGSTGYNSGSSGSTYGQGSSSSSQGTSGSSFGSNGYGGSSSNGISNNGGYGNSGAGYNGDNRQPPMSSSSSSHGYGNGQGSYPYSNRYSSASSNTIHLPVLLSIMLSIWLLSCRTL